MKHCYLYALLASGLFLSPVAQAQLVVEGTNFTNQGTMSNRDSYTIISPTANSSYAASGGAIFNHNSTDANSLRVNNPYNANGTGGSTDNFNGPNGSAGVQGISGSVAPNFSKLVLKNGSTSLFNIANTAGINIFSSLDFQNGITTTTQSLHQAGAIRFQSGASYTGGATDAQHVNGYVSKIGNTAFTFPIGSENDLRTLAIGATSNASNHISAAWITGNPSNTSDPSGGGTHATTSVTGPITSVATVGFWDFIRVAGSGSIPVTVSIPNLSSFAPANELRLVGWNGTSWIDLTGQGTPASGNTENSTLSGVIPENGTITALAVGRALAAPDLTPTLDIGSLTFLTGSPARDFVIRVYEIANVPTTGTVTLLINKLPGFTIGFPTTSGTSNTSSPVSNQNSNWTFTESEFFIRVTSKPGVSITKAQSATIGFTVTRNPGTTSRTRQNISVSVVTDAGYQGSLDNKSIVTAVTAN